MARRCYIILSVITKKTQSISEFALFMGMVIVAYVTISTYIRRGYQARLKTVCDSATELAQTPRQYEPYYVFQNLQGVVSNTESQEDYTQTSITSNTTTNTSQSVTGTVGIDTSEDDIWF